MRHKVPKEGAAVFRPSEDGDEVVHFAVRVGGVVLKCRQGGHPSKPVKDLTDEYGGKPEEKTL